MKFTDYGPGDEITWPMCVGHPNDPRTPDEPDTDALTAHAAAWIEVSGDMLNAIGDRMAAGLDDDEWRDLVIAVMRSNDPALAGIRAELVECERDVILDDMERRQHESKYEYQE